MTRTASQRQKNEKKPIVVEEESEIEDDAIEDKIEKVMNKVMNSFKKEIKMQLKEFEKSLNFTSEKIDDVLEKMDQMQERQILLERDNAILKDKVKTMGKALEELEQYTRNRNIQIDGILKTKDENLEQMVKEIGSKMNVEIKEGEIDVVHRIQTRSNKQPEPIIVQFTTRRKRDEIIIKARENRMNSTELNMPGPKRDVYINEHLTQQRKKLLYEAKQKKKELNYKYVWTRGGKVFMRKTDNSNVITLHSIEDLDNVH